MRTSDFRREAPVSRHADTAAEASAATPPAVAAAPAAKTVLTPELERKAAEFFLRNLNLLRAIAADPSLSDAFYVNNTWHYPGLEAIFESEFHKKAYDEGIVLQNFEMLLAGLDRAMIWSPTREWAGTLSRPQLLACVSYHFYVDWYDSGSLASHSISSGALIPLFEAYLAAPAA